MAAVGDKKEKNAHLWINVSFNLYVGTNKRYREKLGEVRCRMKLRSLVTKVMLCTYIDIFLCIEDSWVMTLTLDVFCSWNDMFHWPATDHCFSYNIWQLQRIILIKVEYSNLINKNRLFVCYWHVVNKLIIVSKIVAVIQRGIHTYIIWPCSLKSI